MFCYICYLDAVDITKQEEIEAERARRRRANDVKDEQMIKKKTLAPLPPKQARDPAYPISDFEYKKREDNYAADAAQTLHRNLVQELDTENRYTDLE